MAFLDNSGDIILDAVLTDTGRMRLAKGDGSFKIAKFALGDDEINYQLYDKNHASGSAYYDIEIVQTPVLEAFTNNTSMMKSKLMTINRTNLLYLPEIVNNTVKGLASNSVNNILTVLVDQASVDASPTGVYINGYRLGDTSDPIRMDQGIKSDALGNGDDVVLDADLRETQYTIEIDNRFGKLWSGDGSTAATPSFVDDDNVAVYYLSSANNMFFPPSEQGTSMSNDVIAGPRGTSLSFIVGPSTNLNSSAYLFTQLGTLNTTSSPIVGNSYQIDTTIRITGVTTGYRVDLPIRFVKKA